MKAGALGNRAEEDARRGPSVTLMRLKECLLNLILLYQSPRP
jgi:hypothetical protein